MRISIKEDRSTVKCSRDNFYPAALTPETHGKPQSSPKTEKQIYYKKDHSHEHFQIKRGQIDRYRGVDHIRRERFLLSVTIPDNTLTASGPKQQQGNDFALLRQHSYFPATYSNLGLSGTQKTIVDVVEEAAQGIINEGALHGKVHEAEWLAKRLYDVKHEIAELSDGNTLLIIDLTVPSDRREGSVRCGANMSIFSEFSEEEEFVIWPGIKFRFVKSEYDTMKKKHYLFKIWIFRICIFWGVGVVITFLALLCGIIQTCTLKIYKIDQLFLPYPS
ncbi:unnamed protein product [Rotaria socialis]|uniref:Uncharacterized protein n=1 Tax=Rotaria socialis TaxID=392032 RepID=A0A821FSK7_9BILA|nr:unnamed protein product [Rotaria socialis]CAF4655528.1 unnamed protein product [Rotaria socialis]